VEQQKDTEEDDDEFGDFEATEALLAVDTLGAAQSLAAALEELGPLEDAPRPSWNGGAGKQQENYNEDNDDEFGDFEAPQEAAPREEPQDVFGPNQDLPLPSLDAQHEMNGFGGFSENTSPVPLSSALDALGSSHDAPLPTLDAFGVKQQSEEDADADEFGDFEDSPAGASESEALPESTETDDAIQETTLPPEGETTGEFAGLDALREVTSLSSALDELGSIQDAPLEEPGLKSGTDYAADPLSSALDSLGPVEDISLPLLDAVQTDPSQDETTDEFGDFEDPNVVAAPDDPSSLALDSLGPIQDVPLPSLGATQQGGSTDAFGSFESQASADKLGGPFASAFDALGPAEDAPLLQLGISTKETASPQLSEEGDNEFGDFEAPVKLWIQPAIICRRLWIL